MLRFSTSRVLRMRCARCAHLAPTTFVHEMPAHDPQLPYSAGHSLSPLHEKITPLLVGAVQQIVCCSGTTCSQPPPPLLPHLYSITRNQNPEVPIYPPPPGMKFTPKQA